MIQPNGLPSSEGPLPYSYVLTESLLERDQYFVGMKNNDSDCTWLYET